MSTVAHAQPVRSESRRPVRQSESAQQLPPVVAALDWEDASPYGLQGLARETLRILKPECITRMAMTLALRGTPEQIRDPEFVNRQVQLRESWVEEYHVVHLIERSLWIQGHNDLVMTLIRNPSQIPDNPPREIQNILTEAYGLHPQATIWYGVPMFGEETTPDGLPIPVTAEEVRQEAARRIEAVQQHALRWGWFYRSLLRLSRLPAACARGTYRLLELLLDTPRIAIANWFRRVRKMNRRRVRAQAQAQLEYCRSGRILPPADFKEDSLIDRFTLGAYDASGFLVRQALATAPIGAGSSLLFSLAKISILTPAPFVLCDPFLFLELPEEPGKLRQLGHWYWQDQPDGSRKLHLHV